MAKNTRLWPCKKPVVKPLIYGKDKLPFSIGFLARGGDHEYWILCEGIDLQPKYLADANAGNMVGNFICR